MGTSTNELWVPTPERVKPMFMNSLHTNKVPSPKNFMIGHSLFDIRYFF